MSEGTGLNIKKRKRARQLLVQALYQWSLNETSPIDLEIEFQQAHDFGRIDREYFSKQLNGIINEVHVLDEHIAAACDLSLNEVNPVELAVLRLAAYELLNLTDIPFRVIINEALDVTKLFGAEEGYRFVNGVLDTLAGKLRPMERGGAGV